MSPRDPSAPALRIEEHWEGHDAPCLVIVLPTGRVRVESSTESLANVLRCVWEEGAREATEAAARVCEEYAKTKWAESVEADERDDDDEWLNGESAAQAAEECARRIRGGSK